MDNKPEYISREAINATLRDQQESLGVTAIQKFTIERSLDRVRLILAADVAPVVRCGSCKRMAKTICADPIYCDCSRTGEMFEKTHFCGYGVRMDLKGEDAK